MKDWKKPVFTVVFANQLTEAIKAKAYTCVNAFVR